MSRHRALWGAIHAAIAIALIAFVVMTPSHARAQDTVPAVEPAAPADPPVVVDTVPPVITWPPDIAVTAFDPAGMVIDYQLPIATDDIDGPVGVWCDPPPSSFFPAGTSVVTCGAQDSAGNAAALVSFSITVTPPPPVPTEPPLPTNTPEPPATLVPTLEPTLPPEPTATVEPTPTIEPSPTPEGTATPEPTPTVPASPTSSPTVEPTATVTPEPPSAVPPRAALDLPWPLPPPLVLVTGSGSLDPLAAIWGYHDFPISQEYGHTHFSLSQPTMYRYGLDYGLDGRAHPGLDIGMPAGTPLYSPVNGTVLIAGGTPYFTFYKNGEPGVGELLIRTDAGDEVVLGHMGRIAVLPHGRVVVGQFVGLSGGENGDHLHLETRELQSTGNFLVSDPRESFLIEFLTSASTPTRTPTAATAAPVETPAVGVEPSSTPVATPLWADQAAPAANDHDSSRERDVVNRAETALIRRPEAILRSSHINAPVQ